MNGNTDLECSENYKVEGEDSWRKVNCLRGRLLAERMASRNARDDADQLETRLMEVEMLLEQEGKSRKRAEKKLKWLRKKLECINIESQQSVSVLNEKITDRLVLSALSADASNETPKPDSSSPGSSCGGGDDDHNSMALVAVEMTLPEKEEAVDPEILDATVRQVLESLRRAKEQLQSSMDERRRRMNSNIIIKVG